AARSRGTRRRLPLQARPASPPGPPSGRAARPPEAKRRVSTRPRATRPPRRASRALARPRSGHRRCPAAGRGPRRRVRRAQTPTSARRTRPAPTPRTALVDVIADLIGDLADDVRELLLDARVDRLAHARGQVTPQPRVLAPHDPLDHLADVAAGGGGHVLGDRLRSEPAAKC